MSNSNKSNGNGKAQGPVSATTAAPLTATEPPAPENGNMELEATIAERDALKARLDEVTGELDKANLSHGLLQDAFDAAKRELDTRDTELSELREAINRAAGAAAGVALAAFDADKEETFAPTTWTRDTALNTAEAKLADKLGVPEEMVMSVNLKTGVIVTADGRKHSVAAATAQEGDA